MGLDTSGLDSIFFEAFSKTVSKRYLYACNMETGVSRWSRNACDNFDLPGEYFLNAGDVWGNLIHPEDRQMYFDDIEAVFSGKKNSHNLDYRVLNKEGEYVLCTCKGIVQRGFQDGKEIKIFVGEIEDHSVVNNIDGITNLYNIYEFQKHIKKNEDPNLSILLIGICSFSEINDLYGYKLGNKALSIFAKNLLEFTRGLGKCYKLDGVKFAVCFNNISKNEIIEFYKKINHYTRHNLMVNGIKISISLAGGVVENIGLYDESTISTCARYALFKSKREKNGEIVFYDNALLNNNKRNLELIQAIKYDISTEFKGFYLKYQPIVDLNGSLVGVEALIRWKSDTYGEVSPNEFIPILENDAAFYDLGVWILSKALRDMRNVIKNFPNFILNVNVSYPQLLNKGFKENLKRIVSEHNFPGKNLCLELTERCRLLELNVLKNEIEYFNSLGIEVALDDFGTGFSSLSLLSKLSVKHLKIDSEFMKNIENNKKNIIIVKAITQCAKELGINVCVEGIENSKQDEFVKKTFDINSIQGFFYSKPLTIDEFDEKYLVKEDETVYTKEKLSRYKFYDNYDINSIIDPLTGVLLREYVVNFAKYLINENIPFSYQIVDMDNFKLINDYYGHQEGDNALIQIGHDLVKYVGDKGVVGRFGGDEFMIINLFDTSYDDVYYFLKHIYGSDSVFRKIIYLKTVTPFVTATIGSASFPLNAKTYDELFNCVDKALYRGKQKGRNCFIVYVYEKHKDIDCSRTIKTSPTVQMNSISDILEANEEEMIKITKAMKYIENTNGIYKALIVSKEGNVIDSDLNKFNIGISQNFIENYISPDTKSYVCDVVDRLKDSDSTLYELVRSFSIISFSCVPISYGNEIFGYLVLAEKYNARIWQEENLIVMKYCSKQIAMLKKLNKTIF